MRLVLWWLFFESGPLSLLFLPILLISSFKILQLFFFGSLFPRSFLLFLTILRLDCER